MEAVVAAASTKLKIVYGDRVLYPGEELTPTQVQNQPEITWDKEDGALYTLLFTDIDIPDSFGFKQFTHWLVVNISGNDIQNGTTIFNYVGSGPPEGRIGQEVTGAIKDTEIGDRGTFDIEEFQKKNNLQGPLASNYYRAQYDAYVPILMKSFKAKYNY